jgi:hypothetical protein
LLHFLLFLLLLFALACSSSGVGFSTYWKGAKTDYPWFTNTLAPANYFAQVADAQGPEGGATSIYREYCVKYGKPLVVAEGAGAYHVNVSRDGGKTFTANDPGPGQAAVVMVSYLSFSCQASFCHTTITNASQTPEFLELDSFSRGLETIPSFENGQFVRTRQTRNRRR